MSDEQIEQDAVLTDRRDGVQVITINRAHAKNALNGAVARGIAAAVDELDEDDDLRVGVLTGAGGTFSAGMDLKAFLTGDVPLVEGRGLGGITQRPPRKPLIGAVEGWAVAGGFELLLACDLVVASETSRLGVPEVKRALVAGAGAAMLLTRRIPRSPSSCCSPGTRSPRSAPPTSASSTGSRPRAAPSTVPSSLPRRSRATGRSPSRSPRRSRGRRSTGTSSRAGTSSPS